MAGRPAKVAPSTLSPRGTKAAFDNDIDGTMTPVSPTSVGSPPSPNGNPKVAFAASPSTSSTTARWRAEGSSSAMFASSHPLSSLKTLGDSRLVNHASLSSVAATGICVAGLALADFARWAAEQPDDPKQFGLALVVLYVVLTLVLAASALLCLRRDTLPLPSWLAIAALQSGVLVASSLWRAEEWGQVGAHAARLTAALQPMVVFLCGSSFLNMVLALCASSLVVIVPELLWTQETLVESIIVLALFSVAALWNARRIEKARADAEAKWVSVRDVVLPILEELSSPTSSAVDSTVNTELDCLVAKLLVSKDTLMRSSLDKTFARKLVKFLSFLQVELKSVTKAQYIPQASMQAETPMTEAFLMETLGQSRPAPRPRTTMVDGEGPRNTVHDSGEEPPLETLGTASPQKRAMLVRQRSRLPPSREVFTQVNESISDMCKFLVLADGTGERTRPSLNGLTPTAGNMENQLGRWDLDVFEADRKGGKVLSRLGHFAIHKHCTMELNLDSDCVESFLVEIQKRYSHMQPYHNSLHAADVLNNMVYYLRLSMAPYVRIEPTEWLASMVAAICHDVGHTGTSNRFHTNADTPLARLYSDCSVLENMHCTLTFAVLRVEFCDLTKTLEYSLKKAFKSLVVKMILETDLGKHVMLLSRFRQEFLHLTDTIGEIRNAELETSQIEQLLSFILKACDVGHSAKPFDLHAQWTMRINTEFFTQGDTEQEFCLPVSPFCDRRNTDLAESQLGFFKFIVIPLHEALDEFLQSPKMRFEVMPGITRNHMYWSRFTQSFCGTIDRDDPISNVQALKRHFNREEREAIQERGGLIADDYDVDGPVKTVSEGDELGKLPSRRNSADGDSARSLGMKRQLSRQPSDLARSLNLQTPSSLGQTRTLST